MRRAIKKVDSNGKTIQNFAAWKKLNPNAVSFDSMLEYNVDSALKCAGVKYVSQPGLELFSSIETTEFTKPRRTKKAIKENRTARETIAKVKQESIKYTPDFYLSDYDIYIEVKGYADEAFRMRWKLFKILGYKGYIVYSVKEMQKLLELLK